MKWTNDEIEKAVNLLKEGNTYEIIAIILNRTKKSVKEKLNKIGIKQSDYTIFEFYHTKKCDNCHNEFTTLISENRKFCSNSCSASTNNKLRGKKTNKCLNCGLITNNKYCSPDCHGQYKRNIIFKQIEEGVLKLPSKNYKNYLIYKFGEKCMECGWSEMNMHSKKIPIELEHIDGNSENNSLQNLKLLCPNCHSLTPTYKALNIGNGRHKRMQRYNNGQSY